MDGSEVIKAFLFSSNPSLQNLVVLSYMVIYIYCYYSKSKSGMKLELWKLLTTKLFLGSISRSLQGVK